MNQQERKHHLLKKMKNDILSLWQRNVVDKYKSLSNEEIKLDLEKNKFPFAVLIENWIGDFNQSSAMRNCNAFGAKEIFYIGQKRFDARGLQGINHYSDIKYIKSYEEVAQLKKDYVFVGIENNIPGAKNISDFKYPNNSLLIFGCEGSGLTKNMLALCDVIVEIPMRGSVRSLNCGTASGIVVFDYCNKYMKENV
jgi:tRNA G18 (ribose-2'-O)-methylase SpoU